MKQIVTVAVPSNLERPIQAGCALLATSRQIGLFTAEDDTI